MGIELKYDNENHPYIPLGNHQLRLELEEPTESLYLKVQEKNEEKNKLNEALETFKELVKAEPDLKLPIDDDKFFIKFLRPFEQNVNRSFKILKRYYTFKIKHPDYAGKNVTPQEIRHVFDANLLQFTPTRSQSGGRIMIINCGTNWNTQHVPLKDLFKAIIVAVEIAMLEPKTQLGGCFVIINLKGLSTSHVMQFTPNMAQLLVNWVETCAPIKLNGIHVIHQPLIFKVLFSIFRPILGPFLKERLHFHGNELKDMCEIIGWDRLPQELGGNGDFPLSSGKSFSEMLFYYEDEFNAHHSYGYL